MEFNDLLIREGIDPKEVLVLRHSPKEPKLWKALPWLASEKPKLFNAYQQTQTPRVEKQMKRAKYVASFIGHEPRKALFVGLYRIVRTVPLTYDDFWAIPEIAELKTTYGMIGMINKEATTLWFDLKLMPFHKEWKGKLVVCWPGKELSWSRWSADNVLKVQSIVEDSILEPALPSWRQIWFSWKELSDLPRKWREELSQWKGVYFILDESDGKGYVGSASGTENLLGRWLTYARSGHGGNKKLRGRNPERFRFSVLERFWGDINPAEVRETESAWKIRLHTLEYGLNDN